MASRMSRGAQRLRRKPQGSINMTGECICQAGRALTARLRLIGLNQVADALRIALAVTVARDGISPAGRFNNYFSPEHTSRNMYRSNLRHGDTFFVAAEQSRLDAADPLRADNKLCRKKEITLCPTAGSKSLARRTIDRIVWDRAHASVRRPGNLRSAARPLV